MHLLQVYNSIASFCLVFKNQLGPSIKANLLMDENIYDPPESEPTRLHLTWHNNMGARNSYHACSASCPFFITRSLEYMSLEFSF